MNYDLAVDIRGLCCAQPIIRIAQSLKTMQSGQVLMAISDKPSMSKDIPAFCKQTGNCLIHQSEQNGTLQFWIKLG